MLARKRQALNAIGRLQYLHIGVEPRDQMRDRPAHQRMIVDYQDLQVSSARVGASQCTGPLVRRDCPKGLARSDDSPSAAGAAAFPRRGCVGGPASAEDEQ